MLRLGKNWSLLLECVIVKPQLAPQAEAKKSTKRKEAEQIASQQLTFYGQWNVTAYIVTLPTHSPDLVSIWLIDQKDLC